MTIMKFKTILLSIALVAGAVTSCTDTWDDHYTVATHGEGTLWQQIGNDASLSNFKAVLEAAGYDKLLNSSQVFTVFAPTNDQLSDDARDKYIAQYKEEKAKGIKDEKNSVIKEFVQNHISLYNYSTSSEMPDGSIRMMNGKRNSFTNEAFAGKNYLSKNNLTSNGLLYKISGQAGYIPSVYEQLSKDPQLSNVWDYLSEYSIEEFQPNLSVPGEIIDGKTHYLDSVTVTTNEILEEWLQGEIENEDSTYWMVVPTNDVWKKKLEENEKYFVYDKKVSETERDSFQYHFPRYSIIVGSVFSQTSNQKIFQEETALATDSAMSTNAVPYLERRKEFGSYDKKFFQYNDPFGKNGVFTGTQNTECSNGRVMKAADWHIPNSMTFLREIVMEGESNTTLDSLNVRSTENKAGDTNPVKNVNVTTDNPFYNKVSGHGYLEISPSGTGNFTKALFDVRGVLSNVPYDVYVVTAPAEAGDTTATEQQCLPTVFRCTIQCHDMEGNAYYTNTKGELKLPVFVNNDETRGPTTNYTNSAVAVDRLATTAGVVDSVFIGTYTFPTCSYKLNEAQVKLVIDSRVSNTQLNNKQYNRTLRLDCIVFKPHEEE